MVGGADQAALRAARSGSGLVVSPSRWVEPGPTAAVTKGEATKGEATKGEATKEGGAVSERTGCRRYRVVFTADAHGVADRRGVIVARDEEAAHREARKVADAGGRAEVQHVGEGGTRRVLAVYPTEDGAGAG